ncbi:hypothetical protein D8S78_02900 [Natrialba swarupiae]|nr:hypothetical protein [Natrialba swarupiae]
MTDRDGLACPSAIVRSSTDHRPAIDRRSANSIPPRVDRQPRSDHATNTTASRPVASAIAAEIGSEIGVSVPIQR